MEVYLFFFCCVFLTTTVSFSLQSDTTDVPEYEDATVPIANCACENGKCVTDKHGNTKCACKPGYALQDQFTCKPCDCGSLGKCIFILKPNRANNMVYQKKCVCDVGKAEKAGVCVDCFCGENSACDFDSGERRCYCLDGFSEKNKVCTRCDCGFNGNCQYDNDYKKCQCDEGYLEVNGMCLECDCGNDGSCSYTNGQKMCNCRPGFTVKNGICERCDCGSNSVSCQFIQGAKVCSCRDGYADRYGTCEQCYCGQYGRSCNFENNQKSCGCSEGYVQKGETCEMGCSNQNPCRNGGYCKGGFCFCTSGTRGEFCDVIDECSNLCPNKKNIACDYDVRTQRAYCRCLDNNSRYNPNLRECQRNCESGRDCYNGGQCSGDGSSRFCNCLTGTSGDHCEYIDDCTSGRRKCNEQDSYCTFDVNRRGSLCQCRDQNKEYDYARGMCRGECDNYNDCMNGGRCRVTNGRRSCECLRGTQGEKCEIIDDCASGDIKCRGGRVSCDFDERNLRGFCRCIDYGKVHDPYRGRCRRPSPSRF